MQQLTMMTNIKKVGHEEDIKMRSWILGEIEKPELFGGIRKCSSEPTTNVKQSFGRIFASKMSFIRQCGKTD